MTKFLDIVVACMALIASAAAEATDTASDAPKPTSSSFVQKMFVFLGSSGQISTIGRPYTKWYNIHERFTLADFQGEAYIILAATILFSIHFSGVSKNRTKANAWARANGGLLKQEYAMVGFGGSPTVDSDPNDASGTFREKSLFEFQSYATGRRNVAFTDVNLVLNRRFNPLVMLIEAGISFMWDTITPPADQCELITYPFDGLELKTIRQVALTAEPKTAEKSTYDGFVWGIVNKDQMKRLRNDRYDLSLTFTKDSPKLPIWATVMSESAEITAALLTKDLVAAIESAGDLFDYLVVTDQPGQKPTTLEETRSRKRIFCRYRLPGDNNYEPLQPLMEQFLRLPDHLVSVCHFRPEVLRKVKTVRESAISQIKKEMETEKAEERAAERERLKKSKREEALTHLDAKAQKKYLDKEREKEIRKMQKKSTVRG
ncbi:hypothetical protein Cpir12675_004562 [Ceratocystis pirilliformis]|uniref:Uncharacterized protein n=1 Tax=Ceratocystis pirilliformis TaxID=259994 RepID=A0ABR3YWN6_9PEZI